MADTATIQRFALRTLILMSKLLLQRRGCRDRAPRQGDRVNSARVSRDTTPKCL
jgi:hypothetical protein